MTCGIYKITNIKNGKFYIGSSENVEERWSGHKSELKRGKHVNRHLQYAWNKNGKESFIFEILETFQKDRKFLLQREQFYLDMWEPYDRNVGYNLCEMVNGTLGFKHSEETKKKMRGENSSNAKLTWKKVEEIRQKYSSGSISISSLAKEYRTCDITINKIIRNLSWIDESVEVVTKKLKWDSSGENNPMFGRRHSSETKEHWSEIRKNTYCGEKSTSAKITQNEAFSIRKIYNDEFLTQKELADRFNVKTCTIGRIVNNVSFKDELYTPGKYDSRGKSFLSRFQVEEIKKMFFDKKRSVIELAKFYNVNQKTIIKIINNETFI